MTKYSVEIMPAAKNGLVGIQKKDAKRILDKIKDLEDDPRPRWTEKLKVRPGLRLSIGDYRVIYSVDDKKKYIAVVEIGDRKEVYKK